MKLAKALISAAMILNLLATISIAKLFFSPSEMEYIILFFSLVYLLPVSLLILGSGIIVFILKKEYPTKWFVNSLVSLCVSPFVWASLYSLLFEFGEGLTGYWLRWQLISLFMAGAATLAFIKIKRKRIEQSKGE